MRRLFCSLGAALLINLALPACAQAQADDAAIEASGSVFSGAALADDELADVYGMGLARPSTLQRAARDDFESFSRVTSQTMPVTFENWFNDVARPLIVSNLVR